MTSPESPKREGDPSQHASRAPYIPPALERLGRWSALTLQQSIPVGPGSWMADPGRAERA